MTCSKNDLIGLFNTLEKDEEKIDALNEQIKVIKNGPQGINAEIKAFAKNYEANEKDVKAPIPFSWPALDSHLYLP